MVRTPIAFALLLVLALIAYSNTLGAVFHFDDFHQVVENPNVRDLGKVPRFFVDAAMGSRPSGLRGYRPMTHASFAVNYALSGYDVWSYHLLNFLLHLLNAFMVSLVVMRVLKDAGRADPFPVALAASLIFALHPIQTGGVTYISSRASLLATLFYMLAFYGFLRFRSGTGGRAYIWAALSPLCYLMGLMSKEMAVSLPAMMVLYDILFTTPRRGGVAKSFGAALYYTPFVLALGAYLFVRKTLTGLVTVPVSPITSGEYLMSEAKVLLMYVRLLILPINQNADYNLPPTLSMDFMAALAVVLVLAALVMLYRQRVNNPALCFFGCWFFIALAPESTLVSIPDIAVEYRLYLPSVGFIAAVVMLADGLLKKREALKKAILFPLIAMLLILTFNRNAVWATEHTLWSDAANKAPYSARAHANLANALTAAHRYADAAKEFRLLLDTGPDFPEIWAVHNNIGACYLNMGDVDDALDEFTLAIRLNPGSTEARVNIQKALAMQKKGSEPR